jgi:hypothetical protein
MVTFQSIALKLEGIERSRGTRRTCGDTSEKWSGEGVNLRAKP